MKNMVLTFLILVSALLKAQDFQNLAVGKTAEDFKINTLQGYAVQLSDLYAKGPVVMVVLRGWVGYQCPICSRQTGQFISEAQQLKQMNASVLFVYPGPSELIAGKASDFTKDFELPEDFYFALDPDFEMINQYRLRWDEPRESAYPSTFIVNREGKIVFSKISKTHGGRAKVDEIIEVLKKL